MRRLVLIKQASDLNSATINQIVMHRLAESAYDTASGGLARPLSAPPRRHAGGAAATHARGRELDAAHRRAVRLGAPARGYRQGRLLERSVSEAGVAFVPGAAFFFDGRGRNTLRLSYSLPSEAEIEHGIARLARLI